MSDMIEVKTAELSGAALDWAVMICVKGTGTKHEIHDGKLYLLVARQLFDCIQELSQPFMPSTRWQEGGPLLDSWMVSLHCPQSTDDIWAGWVITDKGEFCQGGDTPLIAACRAIVASKLGDTVQVPRELLP